MLTIRIYRVMDEIVAKMDCEPIHTNGWPQVPQAPFNLAYLQVDEASQMDNPMELLPIIERVLTAAGEHIHLVHGGMYDAVG